MQKPIRLGYSTGKTDENFTLLDWVKGLKNISVEAIELCLVRADRTPKEVTSELLKELSEFKKIFIHAPVKLKNEWVKYPSEEIKPYVNQLKVLINEIENVDYVLFHPDSISDFEYVNGLFGTKLTFENMDKKKSFGTSVEDMRTVFNKSPQANWVCDINHIFTMDRSMMLAKDLHRELEDRLVYYHVSALGSFHDMFINCPKEEVILKGILNPGKLLIHEGFNDPKVIPSLKKEAKFIENWFKKRD